MKILITLKGGSSSIEGEAPFETMEKISEILNHRDESFIVLDKTPHGSVVVNKSAIGYIRKAQ